jgi:hypothetical protein
MHSVLAGTMLALLGACAGGDAPTAPSSPSTTTAFNVATSVLTPDLNGDVTITAPGHYTSTADFRTITISSNDVTLDGLRFVGGAPAAVRNGTTGLQNVTVKNSTFRGYTGRSITFGFAEGVANTTRASAFTVSNNTIEQDGSNATAIALFNIDGVVVNANRVTYVAGTTGRRGINLDGNNNVLATGNVLNMDLDNPTFDVSARSPWGIQLSMSDAPIRGIRLQGNTIIGPTVGIVSLSQRDIAEVTMIENSISAFRGISLNSGSAAPLDGNLLIDEVSIHGNKITAFRAGISLRSLHTPGSLLPGTATVTFRDVKVSGNVVTASGPATLATIVEPGSIIEFVKLVGNPLQ